jgi:hypothetical protein
VFLRERTTKIVSQLLQWKESGTPGKKGLSEQQEKTFRRYWQWENRNATPWLKNTWEGASIKTNLPDVLRQISSILIFLVPNLV